MNKDKKYPSLNIPKKHTLRHYINLVGKLYGETEENIKLYAEEQVAASEHDLDKAIECFKGLSVEKKTF